MTDDFAVDPQTPEAGLPDEWREHVRTLRAENARRRKENQELRAQLESLGTRVGEAETAQAAASERAEHETSRLATVHRRLKELELARHGRQTLHEVAARRTANGGAATLDMAKAQRLLELVPSPVSLDADLVVDDEGKVALEPAAGERLKGFVEELVDLLTTEQQVASPPVGGEPPRPASPAATSVGNAWDADAQRSPAGKARATLRNPAHTTVLDALG